MVDACCELELRRLFCAWGGGVVGEKKHVRGSNGAQNLVAKNPSNKLKAPEHPNPRARTIKSIPCHNLSTSSFKHALPLQKCHAGKQALRLTRSLPSYTLRLPACLRNRPTIPHAYFTFNTGNTAIENIRPRILAACALVSRHIKLLAFSLSLVAGW